MMGRGAPQARIGGVILAGGASRRMLGQRKALLDLSSLPLVEHVIQRLQPQVDTLVLSVAREDSVWQQFGLPQVADERSDAVPDRSGNADTPGPLAGLLSGMESLHDQHDWVLLAPCDAPFVPRDLGEQLLRRAHSQGAAACIAVYDGIWQPTFSLWNCSLLPGLQRAVRVDGFGGFKQFLGYLDVAEQHWAPAEIPPFFNINTAQDLKAAQALLDLRMPES